MAAHKLNIKDLQIARRTFQSLVRQSTGLLILTLFCCCFATKKAEAQTATVPREEVEAILRDVTAALDAHSQEMASEYFDILSKLQDVMDDYDDYVEEAASANRPRHVVSFKLFRENLRNDSYASDPEHLVSDLATFIDSLQKVERAHRRAADNTDDRCCTLLRNLIRELTVVRDLTNDYVDSRGHEDIDREAVRAYLRKELSRVIEKKGTKVVLSKEMMEKVKSLSRLNLDMEDLQEKMAELDEIAKSAEEAKDAAEAVAPQPRPPKVRVYTSVPAPEPPVAVVPGMPVPPSKPKYGRSGNFIDSVYVGTKMLPVNIELQAGDLNIVGTSEQTIRAELDIQVDAKSLQLEKELLSDVELTVSSSPTAFLVRAELPRQALQHGMVVASALVVYVPSRLPVNAQQQSGAISISGFKSGIHVSGNGSTVSVDDIDGGATISNTLGAISIAQVRGALDVTGGFQPIMIDNCQGAIKITNQYSDIMLSSSKGPLTILNTGRIEIDSHQGDVNITNSYGAISIDNVMGNLQGTNAFGEIQVENINGDAILVNNFAPITVTNVSGKLTASSSSGLISVEAISGSIDINNTNGTTRLLLAKPLAGNSKIQTMFGQVDLMLGKGADLMLSAETEMGDIRSLKAIQVIETGSKKTATLKVGTGKFPLRIMGNNSIIMISDEN